VAKELVFLVESTVTLSPKPEGKIIGTLLVLMDNSFESKNAISIVLT
jgi:hypothetical protein